MSNQAHPVEELEGSVDPRSIKYEHSKHSIKNGVFVDVIFSDVEHDEVCFIFCTLFMLSNSDCLRFFIIYLL